MQTGWCKYQFDSLTRGGVCTAGHRQGISYDWKVHLILAATKQLYEWSCPSVLSVCLASPTLFSQCSSYRIIMQFSGPIIMNKSDNHAKDQGQGSEVKVTEVKTFFPQFGRFRAAIPVWIHTHWDDYKMMYKAWRGVEEVSYCFSSSSVIGHMGRKIADFRRLERFRTVTPVWINRWLRNNCTELEMASKSCPNVFRGHASNFKVIRTAKSSTWFGFECFWMTTSIWIRRWLWNDTHSF